MDHVVIIDSLDIFSRKSQPGYYSASIIGGTRDRL